VSTIGTNSFYGIVSSNPSTLNYGNIIDSNLIWSNGTDTLINYTRLECTSSDTSGNWRLMTDQYLPVKISITGNNYFGWIRMQMNIAGQLFTSFALQDYAYNSIPNQPILAGQTMTTGVIENSFASSINLFPNPADHHLTIDLGSNNKKVHVTITDITGKVIYTTIATDTQKVEVNTKDFAEGIYVVQIQTGEFIETKIFIVEK